MRGKISDLTESTKNKARGVDWKAIIGLRNVLVHEYFGVKLRDYLGYSNF